MESNIGSLNEQIDNELAEILGRKKLINRKNILVLSGGGVKGISQLGALKALDDLGHLKYIDTIAAASVGSIIACLLAIGYSPSELYDFITLFDIRKMRSTNTSNILTSYGLDDGKNVMIVLTKMFLAKKIDPAITFSELYKKTGKKLIMTASCINDKKVYYFSHDTNPDVQVIQVVRMSISIPLFYVPAMYEERMYIDGGCIDNYPIQLFKNELDNVIGIYVSTKRSYTKDINNIEDFLMNMIQCLFEGVTCNSLKGFEKQTINLNLNDCGFMELDLSSEKKHEMFVDGYNAVIKYYK
jgi:NTE family protein